MLSTENVLKMRGILSLSLFISNSNFIKVQGRLKGKDTAFSYTNQVIISKDHPFAKLLNGIY